MTDQGLFTSFMREERPLSNSLRARRPVRELLEQARRAATEDELGGFRGQRLVQQITAIRAAAPVLGPLGLGRIDEGEGTPREIGDGVRVPTARYYARYKVNGDISLLAYWPDKADAELETVDDELMVKVGGYENLTHASREDVQEYWRLNATWRLGTIDDRGQTALYTYLDLTREEERAYAANGTMATILRERYERMAPIVAAIASQTDRFFDEDLPAAVEALVADRSAVLADRAAIVRSLDLPEEWAGDGVLLEEVEPDLAVGDSARPLAETDPSQEHIDVEIVGAYYRLSAKSFSDVLRTMRIWADAVERNPRGFWHLDEDALSDLLSATLNATVPHAQREVYSRSGRTDICIEADVLSAGSGPAKVFICETKWANGRESIVSALETQLFRYLTAHMTSAVLLVLCRQKNFSRARKNALNWASEARGCIGPAIPSAVDTWPIMTYRVDGRLIDVCVATVSVREVTTRAGNPK